MAEDPRRAALLAEVATLAADAREWMQWQVDLGAHALPHDADEGPLPALRFQAPAAAPQLPASPGPVAAASSGAQQVASTAPAAANPGHAARSETLDQVRADLGDCKRCGLAAGRTNLVFGVGNPNASLLLAGEAPGYYEDRTGEPFVGRSGQLLNRMLAAIGLTRDDVYICNVVKCRPPNNRDPEPAEIATCSPFLHRQIHSVAPRVILSLGRFAGVNLTGIETTMGRLRGPAREVQGTALVCTYHPSYLLRSPAMKSKVWDDLRQVRALLTA